MNFLERSHSLFPDGEHKWLTRTLYASPRLLVKVARVWRPRWPVQWQRWQRDGGGLWVFLSVYPYQLILCIPA